ncbi:hypothetical protein ES702_02322 [subsurface metagenome]
MKAKCIMCKQEKEIIFSDWEKQFGSINLCYDCCKNYMPESLEGVIPCSNCNEPFKPQFAWQKICKSCWARNRRFKCKK